MKQLYRTSYALVCLMLVYGAWGQLHDLKFRHLDVHDGLPASSVNVIAKDSLGYMWIGTTNGLCRYDGFSYTVYQHDYRNQFSLPDNNVTSLIVTSNNQLWVGTSRGVCIYDKSKGMFNPLILPVETSQKKTIAAKIFFQDSKGYVWLEGLPDKSLLGYNPVTRDYKRIDFFKHDGGREVNSMYEDTKGNFWISRYQSVYHYEPSTGVYKKISNTRRNSNVRPGIITAFAEAHDGSMWFTSWGGGVERYSLTADKSEAYLVEPTNILNGTKNVVNSPVWMKDKNTGKTNLWMTSEYGLLCFDTLTKKFQVYKPDVYDVYANKIQFGVSRFPGSFFDRAQNILWCWGPAGIDICDFDNQRIQTFHTLTETIHIETGSIDGFINNEANPAEYFVSCFAKNTVMIYNENKGVIEIKKTPVTGGVPVMFQLSVDKIWLSSGNDVWEWGRRQNRFTKINHQLRLPEAPLHAGRMTCYTKDSRGIIWIGSNSNGLGRYDQTRHTCDWINEMQLSGDNNRLLPRSIAAVAEAITGQVYALDHVAGLFEISGSGKNIHRFLLPDRLFSGPAKNLSPVIFYGMVADQKNGLWLNTNQGIIYFDTRLQSYSLADKTHILPSGTADNMAMDKYGYLWLSYADELVAFDPVQNRVHLFNYRNGYQGSPDGSTLLVNLRGELRIGYENRIESVRSDPFEKSVYSLPKVLLRYVVGDRNGAANDVCDSLQQIEVNYKNNNLQMEYALPLYHHPDDMMYSYRLQGYESGWNNAGKTHTAKYTNLPGGSYYFQVKAFDPDSGLYSVASSVLVLVYPPFWKTGWFITLVVLLLVGIFYLAYRYRLNQLLKLERMRVSISSDLHDEVGSTLSSISIYSNVARQMVEADRQESARYLERIETSSREMIDSMSDIVWSINPANDDPAKLLERMRLHAYEVLGAAGVKLHWEEAATLNIRKMKMDGRKNFYLIFKEAINNAAKYAHATDITIVIKTVHNQLHLAISDNGVGFDPDQEDRSGNGLRNMQQRSRLLKGQLAIVSSPGNGTRIQLSFLVG